MPVHFLDCSQRTTTWAIAVSGVLEVSLEDRLEHDLGSGLDDAIANGRDAERALAITRRFRNHHAPHRIGPVSLRDQFLAQACEPRFQALRLDLVERHPVDARSTRIGAGEPVGVEENVRAMDLVVEQVEAERRLRLRLHVELSLQAPDLFRRCKAHRQSPAPCLLRKRTRSQGPLLHRRYPASTLERPCPTPAVAVTRGDVEAATLTLGGSPSLLEPPCVRAVPTTPADRNGCICRLLPRPTRPSPNSGWVGIRIVLFEACSGFTRVTARMLAQPHKAAFVTGLRRSRLPGHAAR